MRKVEVTTHNKVWASMFEEEANKLRDIIGSEIIEIHHIGSTSVNGLKAKPIVDIMPVVKNIDRVDEFNTALSDIGYEPKGENGIPGRRYFQKGKDDRTHHVHIYGLGNSEIERHLAFRDYLRSHPNAMKEYGNLKKELSQRFPDDIEAYIRGKEHLVSEIEKRAMAWYRSRERKFKMNFIAPSRLQSGDTVAVLSPSAGVPSLFPHIFEKGIQVLKEEFGLNVKEMSTARATPDHLYHNPKERAENINEAFADPDIKAIISSIGGDDSVRILPYLDQEVIQKNPKIIMGFSDNTTFLTYCNQLGLVTFYGPTIMAGGISQLRSIGEKYKQHITDLLFNQNDGYEYKPFQYWSEGYPDWAYPKNTGKINEQKLNSEGWNWLQGHDIKRGRLFGGNIEVFEMMKGTKYFPENEIFDDKIMFLENGEGTTTANQIKRILRSYGMKGILERIQGLIFGRARDYSSQEKEQLDNVITSVIQDEFHQYDLPIISNMDFGHTDPFSVLPLGTTAEIDCKQKRVKLMESSVV